MIDGLLGIIAPHRCLGCAKMGSLLCANCQYNIIDDRAQFCIMCQAPCISDGICRDCTHKVPFQRAWIAAKRTGVVKQVIDTYKFAAARQAHRPLGAMLHATVADVPAGTVVTWIPTVPAHARRRSFDHARLLAKRFAHLRGLQVKSLLGRNTNAVQTGASRKQRQAQASQAFYCRRQLAADVPYLIIDDTVTTGATLAAAAAQLKYAGARTIWVAALARQSLE